VTLILYRTQPVSYSDHCPAITATWILTTPSLVAELQEPACILLTVAVDARSWWSGDLWRVWWKRVKYGASVRYVAAPSVWRFVGHSLDVTTVKQTAPRSEWRANQPIWRQRRRGDGETWQGSTLPESRSCRHYYAVLPSSLSADFHAAFHIVRLHALQAAPGSCPPQKLDYTRQRWTPRYWTASWYSRPSHACCCPPFPPPKKTKTNYRLGFSPCRIHSSLIFGHSNHLPDQSVTVRPSLFLSGSILAGHPRQRRVPGARRDGWSTCVVYPGIQ